MSLFDTAKYIQSTGGMFKFYRGSSIMAMGCIPAHSIFFSIYEISREMFGLNDSENINFMANALTGVLSTAFHDFILNPCDGECSASKKQILTIFSDKVEITNYE